MTLFFNVLRRAIFFLGPREYYIGDVLKDEALFSTDALINDFIFYETSLTFIRQIKKSPLITISSQLITSGYA